jgi:hypothetical protein
MITDNRVLLTVDDDVTDPIAITGLLVAAMPIRLLYPFS